MTRISLLNRGGWLLLSLGLNTNVSGFSTGFPPRTTNTNAVVLTVLQGGASDSDRLGGSYTGSVGAFRKKPVVVPRSDTDRVVDVCGGSNVNSLGALTDEAVPSVRRTDTDPVLDNCGGANSDSLGALANKDKPLPKSDQPAGVDVCGGSNVNSLGVYTEQYVPLRQDKNDPANRPDSVVYQQSTPMLDRYHRQQELTIQRQKAAGAKAFNNQQQQQQRTPQKKQFAAASKESIKQQQQQQRRTKKQKKAPVAKEPKTEEPGEGNIGARIVSPDADGIIG